jgi:hypothetical protein
MEDLSVDGRIILKWTLRKLDERVMTGFISFRAGTSDGIFCE